MFAGGLVVFLVAGGQVVSLLQVVFHVAGDQVVFFLVVWWFSLLQVVW